MDEEARQIERDIGAIHEQYPKLKIIGALNQTLPTLEAKKRYLALLRTLSRYQEQASDDES